MRHSILDGIIVGFFYIQNMGMARAKNVEQTITILKGINVVYKHKQPDSFVYF